MSFLNQNKISSKSKLSKQSNLIKHNKVFLQTCPLIDQFFNSKQASFYSKRASFFTSHKARGSLTVEAALTVPIFLFAILNILCFAEILQTQMCVQAKLHQKAKAMAVEGYAGYPVTSFLTHGSKEMNYSFSRIMQEDRIELVAVCRIAPSFSMIAFPRTFTVVQAKARAFTGYDNTKADGRTEENGTYVFVTESGTAYHMDRDCTHLKLSIRLAEKEELGSLRNTDGCIYKPCQACGRKASGGIVIITNLGDRYHTTVTCSGLKRIIRTIPLREAGAYHPCLRCCGK